MQVRPWYRGLMTEVGSSALHVLSARWNQIIEAKGFGLLDRRISPLIGDVLATGGVIVAKVIKARSANRHCLGDGESGKEIEDAPYCLVRPEEVPGIGLALVEGAGRSRTLLPGGSGVKVKEGDVGEGEVREVSQNGVRQLDALLFQEISGSSNDNGLSGWGHCRLVGFYNMSGRLVMIQVVKHSHANPQGFTCGKLKCEINIPITASSTTMV